MPDTTAASRAQRRIDGGLLVLGGLALLTMLIGAWGLNVRNDLQDEQARNTTLQAEIDQLRSQANATAYELKPAAAGPAGALGTAFFTLSGTGVITVANLEQAPEGRSYQVWFYPTEEAEPIPGATIAVDAQGSGYTLIPADVGLFTSVAVTLEPAAGSTTPTGPEILRGTTGGARG